MGSVGLSVPILVRAPRPTNAQPPENLRVPRREQREDVGKTTRLRKDRVAGAVGSDVRGADRPT